MSDLLDDIPEFNQDNFDASLELDNATATPTATFGLEDIPIRFKTTDDLARFVDRLVFFDQNLQMNRPAWEALDPRTAPPLVFLQQQQEFWVVQRLLTLHRYTMKPERDKDGYYRLITKKSPHYPTNADAILKLTRIGSHMDKEEWDQYLTVITKLLDKYNETVAKPIDL